MRDFRDFWGRRTARPDRLMLAAAALAVSLALPGAARAQVAPSAEAGGSILSVGVMGSGFYLQYGQHKMAGITAFADADAKSRIGIEAEAHWLEFHQTQNVHAEIYSIGPRYHFDLGRFEPYAKGLIGFGDFNFPYNDGYGRYLVLTAGGGLDYVLNSRIHIRLPDFEYQAWPQFSFGATSTQVMSTAGVSAGIRVRIF